MKFKIVDDGSTIEVKHGHEKEFRLFLAEHCDALTPSEYMRPVQALPRRVPGGMTAEEMERIGPGFNPGAPGVQSVHGGAPGYPSGGVPGAPGQPGYVTGVDQPSGLPGTPGGTGAGPDFNSGVRPALGSIGSPVPPAGPHGFSPGHPGAPGFPGPGPHAGAPGFPTAPGVHTVGTFNPGAPGVVANVPAGQIDPRVMSQAERSAHDRIAKAKADLAASKVRP